MKWCQQRNVLRKIRKRTAGPGDSFTKFSNSVRLFIVLCGIYVFWTHSTKSFCVLDTFQSFCMFWTHFTQSFYVFWTHFTRLFYVFWLNFTQPFFLPSLLEMQDVCVWPEAQCFLHDLLCYKSNINILIMYSSYKTQAQIWCTIKYYLTQHGIIPQTEGKKPELCTRRVARAVSAHTNSFRTSSHWCILSLIFVLSNKTPGYR
jgi:hypothetical protein